MKYNVFYVKCNILDTKHDILFIVYAMKCFVFETQYIVYVKYNISILYMKYSETQYVIYEALYCIENIIYCVENSSVKFCINYDNALVLLSAFISNLFDYFLLNNK